MNARVYDQITKRIIALMAQGTVPWHKPWKARTGLPRNFVTQKPFRGINVFLLLAMNYESPFWLTFRQALQQGGNVRQGEKSCPVVFWKKTTIEDEKSGQSKEVRVLRVYHVFNVAQCDGLKNNAAPMEILVHGGPKPAEIVAHMPQPPTIKHGMVRAYYLPLEDCVGMPARERFERAENYYATLFHELVHATGQSGPQFEPGPFPSVGGIVRAGAWIVWSYSSNAADLSHGYEGKDDPSSGLVAGYF